MHPSHALRSPGPFALYPCARVRQSRLKPIAQPNELTACAELCPADPDKLVGHSDEDIRRGSLLFKRASEARDELLSNAEAGCDTQLDAAIYQTVVYLASWVYETGATSIGYAIFEFVWALVTFQFDLSTTISFLLLSMTVLSTLKGLLSFIFATGPITATLSIVTYSVIGPLPSIYRFVVLPPLRFSAFVERELLPFIRGTDDEKAQGGEDESHQDLPTPDETAPADDSKREGVGAQEGEGVVEGAGISNVASASDGGKDAVGGPKGRLPPPNTEAPKRGLRQRKAGSAKDGREPTMAAPGGAPEVPPEVQAAWENVGSMPLRKIIGRKPLADYRLSNAARHAAPPLPHPTSLISSHPLPRPIPSYPYPYPCIQPI